MNHKVLLADDSLTIQKVIKITLANQPYDIVDCSSDDELFKQLSTKPELVFLDFNLSEKYSGYELCSKIKEAVPSAKVLLLLGTFDTVDDAAMEKCGASDKIVKPFDSNKFIAICKRLVDTSVVVEEIKYPEPKKADFVVPNADDQWKVNHTVEQKITPAPEKETFNVRNHLNPLESEVSDWGMSVPGIINDHKAHDKKIDLPNVIKMEAKPLPAAAPAPTPAAAAVLPTSAPVAKNEIKFPENDDLDYPTIEELKNESKSAAAPVEAAKPKSKLISIETFNQGPEIEFEIEHSFNSMDESDVSSIEAQIRDEVEEDLWKVDEFEDLKKEVAAKIEEVKSNFQPSVKDFDESLFQPLDENEEIQWTTADDHAFNAGPSESQTAAPQANTNTVQISNEEIEALIKKHVKEYMDQMFQQKVEKIAWEVIPDLAENLIRQEMAKISHKILNESN
jgi:CheY-like chemotaxis protein